MDAEKLAKKLGIKYKIIQVGRAKDQILRYLPNNKLARANFLVRLRMSILYYYAALMNRLVLGTGNKSELILGYFTKYGDAAVDLMPIGDLYKLKQLDNSGRGKKIQVIRSFQMFIPLLI